MSYFIQYALGAGGGNITTLTGNTGGAVGPTSGNINVPGSHGLNSAGNPGTSTITFAIDNAITLGDLSSIIGSPALTCTTGDVTLSAGNINLIDTTGSTEGVITFGGHSFIHDYGINQSNTFVGANSGNFTLTTASATNNTGLGTNTLHSITTGSGNTAIGNGAGGGFTTGVNNVLIGNAVAGNYVGAESYNINIAGGSGSMGESNVIRIGTNQQTKAYMGGIAGVGLTTAAVVTYVGEQLGTSTITAGTGIAVTAGTNDITISTTGTTTINYRAITISDSPFTPNASYDDFMGVQTSGGAITITLPDAPATGKVYIIKDSNGSAATNNITVTTVSGTDTIDGGTSFVMNTAYESINVLFDGTNYQVY